MTNVGGRGPAITTPVAARALGATLIVGLIVAFLVNLGLRELGQEFLDVPTGAPPNKGLIPATVFPVIGNCFGCFMSWRMPSRRSLKTFLGVGGFMTLVGTAISLSMVPSGANAGSFATTVAINVAPVILIVSALLYLVRHQPEVPRPAPWWQEEPSA